MKKSSYALLFSFLLLCTHAFSVTLSENHFPDQPNKATNVVSQDLKKIYQRCRQLLLSDTTYATEQSFRLTDDIIYTTDAKGYLSSFNTEGYWNDLDYKSQERSAWPPSWHLYRLMLFAREWHKTGQKAYLEAVHKGLDFWIKNDFKCENWWHNQINIPYIYSSLIIMLDREATKNELAYLDEVLTKRVPQANPTGQNKLWQHDIEARIALIHNDGAAFQKAIDGMKSLVVVSTNEGIQPDWSYHQHGAMLQFGNYGFHYVNSFLFWMTTTDNSAYAFDAARKKILYDYCSNGLRWTVFDQRMDLTAVGRQLRMDCDLKRGEYLNNNFNLLLSDKSLNTCLFTLSGFEKKGEEPCDLSGNKSFWRSDYMIQRSNGSSMMSVKIHGPFVKKIESINSENLLGSFLNDGVSLIQNNGEEYRNIEPFWNWMMLPGTTCDTTLNPADPNVMKKSNVAGFTGQVSNGIEGITAMDYDRDGVKAHKSYFFAGGLMIALGSGIEAPNLSKVVTTIDQKFKHFEITYSPESRSNQWIWLNHTGYFIPGEQELVYKTVYRKGDWSKVDKVSKPGTKTDSLFTLCLGHNRHNSYAYIVNPNCDLASFKKAMTASMPKILSNSKEVQAIETKEGVLAVFYQPVALKISENESIHPNQPCILICKKSGTQKTIWVSDPTRKLNSVQIQLGSQTINVNLPTGDLKGSTAKAVL